MAYSLGMGGWVRSLGGEMSYSCPRGTEGESGSEWAGGLLAVP